MATVMLCQIPDDHYFVDMHQLCWNECPDNTLIIKKDNRNCVIRLRDLSDIFSNHSLKDCFTTANELVAGFNHYGVKNPLLHQGFAIEYLNNGESRLLNLINKEIITIQSDFNLQAHIQSDDHTFSILFPKRWFNNPMVFLWHYHNHQYFIQLPYYPNTTIYDVQPHKNGMVIDLVIKSPKLIHQLYIHDNGNYTITSVKFKNQQSNTRIYQVQEFKINVNKNIRYCLLGYFHEFFIYTYNLYEIDDQERMIISNAPIEQLNPNELWDFLSIHQNSKQPVFDNIK